MVKVSWDSGVSKFIRGDGHSQLAADQHSPLPFHQSEHIHRAEKSIFNAMRYLFISFIILKYLSEPFLILGQDLIPNGCFLYLGFNMQSPTLVFVLSKTGKKK